MATLEVRNYFESGYETEFFGANHETFSYIVNTIYDDNNEKINVCNSPKSIVKLPADARLEKNDMMRLKMIDK